MQHRVVRILHRRKLIALLLAGLIGSTALTTVHAQKTPTRFDPKKIRLVTAMPAERVHGLAFSPDESLLVTASHDDGLRYFDTRNWMLQRTNNSGHGMADCAVFSPLRDSRTLATAGNTSLKLRDAQTGKILFDLKGHNSLIFAIAFSPDGKVLASTGQHTNDDGNSAPVIKLWDVATGRELASLTPSSRGMLDTIVFSPDGRLLATGGSRGGKDELAIGEVVLWDLAAGKETATFESPTGEIRKVAFSPDGRSLAAAVDQMVRGALVVWNVSSGRERYRVDGLPCAALDLDFSPDGRLLAVAVGDMRWRSLVAIIKARNAGGEGAEQSFRAGDINFYQAESGESLGILPLNTPVHRVRFAPRGKYLATAGYDLDTFTTAETLAIWDLYPLE